MKKAYLLQCVCEEGSAFEMDIDNRLFADIEQAKYELKLSLKPLIQTATRLFSQHTKKEDTK